MQKSYFGDAFVFKEKRGWFRTTLPGFPFVLALSSAALSPLGLFSETCGPFKTMKEARKAKS